MMHLKSFTHKHKTHIVLTLIALAILTTIFQVRVIRKSSMRKDSNRNRRAVNTMTPLEATYSRPSLAAAA